MKHVDVGEPPRGRTSPTTLLDVTTSAGPVRPALLLPDRAYGVDRPLLHYTRQCLVQAGREVLAVQWPPDDDASGELTGDDVIRLVEKAVASLPGGTEGLVLLAKSLGTLAIPWAARHGVPGIWLTPRLDVPAVRKALPGLPPGSLLAGGTADPSWDGEVAAASGLPVLQVEGGDHCLEIPGDVRRSIAALGRVVTAVTETLTPSFREDLTPIRGISLR